MNNLNIKENTTVTTMLRLTQANQYIFNNMHMVKGITLETQNEKKCGISILT